MRRTVFKTAALAASILVAIAGYVRPGQSISVVDSLGRTVAVPENARRIISLEPEITRIIVALGAGERLVGGYRKCVPTYEGDPAAKVNIGG